MTNCTLKQKTPLKAYTGLKSNSTLKAKRSLRDSYAAKVKAGLKTPKKSYQKAYKPKYKYFSIFTNDLDTCIMTGDTKAAGADIHVHHIFGAARKAAAEKYGFIIPLRADWHDLASYSIHQDRALDLEYKRACEAYWEDNIGTKEEFIAEFGKWW